MGKLVQIYLPDGQFVWLPTVPRTWTDEGPTTRGDTLRAPLLNADAGGTIAWMRQRPLFQGIQTLAQSIATSTWTALTLDELIDNWSGHSDSSNTSRYYAPDTFTGDDWYLCTGVVPISSNDAAHVHMAGFRVNGGGTIFEGGKIAGGAGHAVTTTAIDLVQINGSANEYVELMAWQNTGASKSTIVSGKTPALSVRWVAPDTTRSDVYTPALPAVPHVWTGSDVWTAAAMNTELRDVARFLQNPPIARLTSQGTSQTIPSSGSTWTSIQLPTESVDNYGGHDPVTNNTRYTAQRSGLYLVAGYASVAEAGTNTGYRLVRLLVNGTTPYGGMTVLPQTSGTTGTGIYAARLLRLTAGDYVEVQMQHTQGANLSVNGGANNCSKLIAVWLSR